MEIFDAKDVEDCAAEIDAALIEIEERYGEGVLDMAITVLMSGVFHLLETEETVH